MRSTSSTTTITRLEPAAVDDQVNLIGLHAITQHAIDHKLPGLQSVTLSTIHGPKISAHVPAGDAPAWAASMHVGRTTRTPNPGGWVKVSRECRLPNGIRLTIVSYPQADHLECEAWSGCTQIVCNCDDGPCDGTHQIACSHGHYLCDEHRATDCGLCLDDARWGGR